MDCVLDMIRLFYEPFAIPAPQVYIRKHVQTVSKNQICHYTFICADTARLLRYRRQNGRQKQLCSCGKQNLNQHRFIKCTRSAHKRSRDREICLSLRSSGTSGKVFIPGRTCNSYRISVPVHAGSVLQDIYKNRTGGANRSVPEIYHPVYPQKKRSGIIHPAHACRPAGLVCVPKRSFYLHDKTKVLFACQNAGLVCMPKCKSMIK